MSTVIAAVDLGPSTARVLHHAAGFARLWSARLRVVHVCSDPAASDRQHVLEVCAAGGPYEVDLTEDDVSVGRGTVSDAIYREARAEHAALVVMGSSNHGSLAALFLGSSAAAVLQNAASPVLLVPPTDFEIIDIADRARLSCGPVLAALDLAANSGHQLQLAQELAQLAGQGLVLMTVTASSADEHVAMTGLRERAHELSFKPHAMIVRHGHVADEISRCALTEGAGLVVMGLRERGRGRPGAIATAVLKTNRAFVLAVPGN